MKAAGICISTLIVIDTFFISFAVGFNSRHVLIVDPNLPPLVQPKAAPAKSGPVKADSVKTVPVTPTPLANKPGQAAIKPPAHADHKHPVKTTVKTKASVH